MYTGECETYDDCPPEYPTCENYGMCSFKALAPLPESKFLSQF